MKPPRSKLRGITRKSIVCETPRFLTLFPLQVTSEQAPRNLLIENVLTEVDILRQHGVTSIFFTDANFIGNRRRAKALLLALAEYGKKTDYEINFSTEVSLDVAEDEALLALFQQANFTLVYIGIESPNVESLQETKKHQNLRFPILDRHPTRS